MRKTKIKMNHEPKRESKQRKTKKRKISRKMQRKQRAHENMKTRNIAVKPCTAGLPIGPLTLDSCHSLNSPDGRPPSQMHLYCALQTLSNRWCSDDSRPISGMLRFITLQCSLSPFHQFGSVRTQPTQDESQPFAQPQPTLA